MKSHMIVEMRDGWMSEDDLEAKAKKQWNLFATKFKKLEKAYNAGLFFGCRCYGKEHFINFADRTYNVTDKRIEEGWIDV